MAYEEPAPWERRGDPDAAPAVQGGWNSGPMSEPVQEYPNRYQHPGPDDVPARVTGVQAPDGRWYDLETAEGAVPPVPARGTNWAVQARRVELEHVPDPEPWCRYVEDAVQRGEVPAPGSPVYRYHGPDDVPAPERGMDPAYVPGGVVPVPADGTVPAVARVDLAPIIERVVREYVVPRATVWYDYGLTCQRSGGPAYVIVLWTDLPDGTCASTSRVLDGIPVPATVESAVRFMLEDLAADLAAADIRPQASRDDVPTYSPTLAERLAPWDRLVARLRKQAQDGDDKPQD